MSPLTEPLRQGIQNGAQADAPDRGRGFKALLLYSERSQFSVKQRLTLARHFKL